MPITVTCTCNASLKAPDRLAGKSVKCPKCSAVVHVPGHATVSSPPGSPQGFNPNPAAGNQQPMEPYAANPVPPGAFQQTMPAPQYPGNQAPPGFQQPMPAPQNPGNQTPPAFPQQQPMSPPSQGVPSQGFDIPPEIQEELGNEIVRGEELNWFGQPSAKMVVLRKYKLFIAGAVFLFISLFPLMFFLAETSKFMFLIGFIVFFLLGLGFALSPILFLRSAKKTWYALTNKRAIVSQFGFSKGKVTSYSPEELQNIRFQRIGFFGNDAGDVILRTKVTITQTEYRVRGSGQYAGSGQETTRTNYGFLSLPNAREIERLVREKLLHESIPGPDMAAAAAMHNPAFQSAPTQGITPAPTMPQPEVPPPPTHVSATCSCGARFKAPAKLAGKTVKCPKCKTPITVPELPPPPQPEPMPVPMDSAAPAPIQVQSPPPNAPPGKEISPYWQEKLQQELGYGEHVLWSTIPSIRIQLIHSLIFGGAGIIVAIVLAIVGAISGDSIYYMFSVGVFVAGIIAVPVALWQGWRKASNCCYFITNRRAMVWKKGWFGINQDNYGPDELHQMYMRKSWFIKGVGDLVFREDVEVSERGRSGGGKGPGPSVTTQTYRYGFMDIDNLEEVHSLVRQTLLGG